MISLYTLPVKAGEAMFCLLIILLMAAASLLKVTLQADLHHSDRTQVQFLLRIGQLHKSWRLMIIRTSSGHRLLLSDGQGAHPLDTVRIQQSRSGLLLGTLRRSDKARRFLLSRTCMDKLDALVLLHTSDAARSAVLSGLIGGMLGCIPAVRRRHVRIRVLPEFFKARSTVDVCCIIRLRMGTIIVTAIMLLAAYIRQQHRTESEAVSYGTSHW